MITIPAAAKRRARFCGDFNSQGASAVRQLLTQGQVLPEFRESGDPTERAQEGRCCGDGDGGNHGEPVVF